MFLRLSREAGLVDPFIGFNLKCEFRNLFISVWTRHVTRYMWHVQNNIYVIELREHPIVIDVPYYTHGKYVCFFMLLIPSDCMRSTSADKRKKNPLTSVTWITVSSSRPAKSSATIRAARVHSSSSPYMHDCFHTIHHNSRRCYFYSYNATTSCNNNIILAGSWTRF
jgi:hypothetical protein